MDDSTEQNPPIHTRRWAGLVRTGAWAAMVSVAIIIFQIAVYVVWPPPETVEEFYLTLHEQPLHGLLALDLLYPISNLLTYLIYLALGVVLWRLSSSAVVVALAFGTLGMAAYMASPRPVEMLLLADLYAGAEPAEKAALVAVGEAMLATWTGTAFDVYYLFNFVTLMIFVVLVFRSRVFGQATAIWGLVAAVLMAIPSNVGTVGLVFAIASLLPWSVFAVLVAQQLFALLKSAPRE